MKKRLMKFVVIALVIFLSFKAQAYALKFEPSVPQELGEDNLEKTGQVVTYKEALQVARPNVTYKARGLRNPFERPNKKGQDAGARSDSQKDKAFPNLSVQGVIWGGKFPQAIINNKVIKVGDTLEDVDIVSIDKEGVTVLFEGVERKLTTLPVMGQQGESGK
jgi:hypothetical protein